METFLYNINCINYNVFMGTYEAATYSKENNKKINFELIVKFDIKFKLLIDFSKT